MFGIIFILQTLEIILRFLTIEIIEVHRYDKPLEIATRYITSWDFVSDIITVVPYNMIRPDLIHMRLVRMRAYTKYSDYFKARISTAFRGLMEDNSIQYMVDSITFGFGLMIVAHLLACYWILIGEEYLYQVNSGWIVKLKGDGKLENSGLISLYITSFYFVMTSFSSVGYGDVTGSESYEYLY